MFDQPFSYMGGKWNMAPFIVSLLPSHQCYVEPFSGSAAVLLHKNPSPVEIVNDFNQDLVNFFLQLRNNLEALLWKLEFTPYSRAIYEGWLHQWRAGKWRPEEPVERAAVWYSLQQMSMSGKFGSGWSHAPTRNQAQSYYTKLHSLKAVADRLRYVQIECKDFEEVIQDYDTEETVIYADPPYVLEGKDTGKEYYAGSVFTLDDHRRLARVLSQIKGKAIVSYYRHPLVDELYPNPPWRRLEIPVIQTSFYEPDNPIKPKATELLLLNYEGYPLDRLLASG